MKTLVIYSSQTGNTKKLAQAAFEILPEPKDCYPIAQSPASDDYDLIVLGFWFKAGQPDPLSTEYLSNIKGKKVFLFATHGAAADSEHAQLGLKAAKEMLKDCTVIGTFNCPGEVNPKILEKAGTKPTPPVWLKDAPMAKGHPSAEDLTNLKQALAKALKHV